MITYPTKREVRKIIDSKVPNGTVGDVLIRKKIRELELKLKILHPKVVAFSEVTLPLLLRLGFNGHHTWTTVPAVTVDSLRSLDEVREEIR